MPPRQGCRPNSRTPPSLICISAADCAPCEAGRVFRGGGWDHLCMGQQQLFSRSEIAAMRDPTRGRNSCAANVEFRREHERDRAYGLARRHASKLRRLYGSVAAAEAVFAERAAAALAPGVDGTPPCEPAGPATEPVSAVEQVECAEAAENSAESDSPDNPRGTPSLCRFVGSAMRGGIRRPVNRRLRRDLRKVLGGHLAHGPPRPELP